MTRDLNAIQGFTDPIKVQKSGGGDIADRAFAIEIHDCANGFPEGYGAEKDVPSTSFVYRLELYFEDQGKLQDFYNRPKSEQTEILHTMEQFMRDAGNASLSREAVDNADTHSLNPQTQQMMNAYVAPELVRIMNASYPGLGLEQARVPHQSEETPGCPIPKDYVQKQPDTQPILAASDPDSSTPGVMSIFRR